MASDMPTDRLALLETARDLLAEALTAEQECPNCGAHIDVKTADLPQVSRELRAVLLDIDKIPGSGEVTPLDKLADDLAERRRRRQTG